MATRFLLFCFLCLPVFSAAQVVDTAMVRREVDSLVALNRKLVGESNFEEALRVIEVADSMAFAGFGGNSTLYANSLINHGRTYYIMRKYDKAKQLLLEVLAIQEKVLGKEHPGYASTLSRLANTYWLNLEYEEAESLSLKALAIRKRVLGKEHPDYAESLNNLGALYMEMGNYEKAEPLLLEAKSFCEKTLGKEHPDYARNLHDLALLFYSKGEYDKAEPLSLEALAIREKILGREHPEYGWTLTNLALIYFAKGEYDKSEPLSLEALALDEKVLGKEHPDFAGSLINLANFYYFKGEYDKAEPLYLEAKEIFEVRLNNWKHPFYMNCLDGLAHLYQELGKYKKAEPLLIEAKAIREKVLGKEHPDYASSLNNLADFYRKMSNYEKSEPLFIEAKAIQEKVLGKEHPNYASNLNNLAILYSLMGNFEKAEQLFLEARDIREKVLGKEHLYNAESLDNLANLYFLLGNYQKAEPLYLESKAIREKVLGREHQVYAGTLNNLALLYRDIGQQKNSEQYFTEASSIIKRILQKSATYLPSQELEKYIALYQDGNDEFISYNHQTNSDSFRIASYNSALFYKGFVLETAAHLEQAMQSAPDSIRDIHSRWKGYNRLLAAELALPIAERKHFAYLDSMSNVLEKALLRASSAFAEAQRQIEWQDVQKALKPGEAAIEFIHYRYSDKKETDSTMYSALLTLPNSKAPLFIPLCEARQLDALIYKANGTRANYLQNLYASTQSDDLLSLNQLIWSPMEKVLGENGIKTIYFAPTGLLHRLNLGALAEGKSGARLADRYKLVPMGSTRLLAEGQTQTEAGHIPLNNALIYGGVRYEMDSSAITKANTQLGATAQDTTGGLFGFSNQTEAQRGENWNYLPGTEKEARYLDGLLRRRNIHTTLRLGYEATEESFKQIGQNGPSPSLLHIGTHGFFFPDPQDTSRRRASLTGNEPVFKISEFSMIRSGLKLAGSRYAWENGHPLPGGHEDGILTAYEVSQMNLSNTQLVVLSACETGLGDIRGNEGVYGLQRAFRIAGAKNVLMSLWKVPDDATEKLMTRFYTHWLSEKKPLRESFEEAQKWLRGQKGFENPYFWAGFVLVGEL